MLTPFPLVSMAWHLLFVMAIAFLVKILCRFDWIRSRPSLMHLLWALVMLKLITPSLIGLPIYDRNVTNNWFQSTQSLSPSIHSFNNSSAQVARGKIQLQAKAEPSFEKTIDQTSPPNQFLHEQNSDLYSLPAPVLLSYFAYFLWIVVAIAFLLRLSFQTLGVMRLQRCLGSDPSLQDAALRVGNRIGCTRVPVVCVIDMAISPSLTGCFRPVILIPKRLTVQLSKEQIEAVLAHELSHYRRGDHRIALVGLVIRSVCWWNPIAWWAYHELRYSQELCCDAMAIGKANVPAATYARSLSREANFGLGKWISQSYWRSSNPNPIASRSCGSIPTATNRFKRASLLSRLERQRRGAFASTTPPTQRPSVS